MKNTPLADFDIDSIEELLPDFSDLDAFLEERLDFTELDKFLISFEEKE